MELAAFHGSLQAAKELGAVVQIGSMDVKKLKSFGLGVDILSAATSGAIVLCVARFEEFLKGAAERTLQMYARAQPPIARSQLDIELQVMIMRRNIAAAVQKTVHGVERRLVDIQHDVQDVARRITNDVIWGDHAIDTQSNPSPKTVADIFTLLGIPGCWNKIEQEFAPLWAAHLLLDPNHKSIPSANKELDSILSWRNICAHTSQAPPIGAREISETIAFLEALSLAIDSLLKNAVSDRISALNSTPAAWI
ncbi:HEPN domain-containing protein [Arthrobacter sp. 2MCAF14]|uniref:HEPN domain-containing protein n=1 Tax=Arthrobacter sp. 2MCAF14 TaxID=3232982 RepID=UPI003F932234